MKKYLFILFSVFMTAISVSYSVMAAESNLAEKTDLKTGVIHVKGKLDGVGNNRSVALILHDDDSEVLSGMTDNSKIHYVDGAVADYDGSFEFLFKYSVVGSYIIDIVSDEYSTGIPYTVFEWDELFGVITKVHNGEIAEDDVYDKISKYFDAFAITMPDIVSNQLKALFNKRVYQSRQNIDLSNDGSNVSSSMKTILNNCLEENRLLQKISSAGNWSQIDPILSDISRLTGVELNTSGDKHQNICSQLIGNLYGSAEEVAKKISDIKSAASSSKAQNSNSSGGGSSGGRLSGAMEIIPPKTAENYEITMVFDDLTDVDWAKKEIIYLANKGIMNGVGDKKFLPHNDLTREQMVAILIRAFNIESDCNECPFEDVSDTEWYYKYICIGYDKGIITGITKDRFGIGDSLTRQDMAVIIYRYVINRKMELKDQKHEFSDSDKISEYAREAVAALAGNDIVSGTSNDEFEPDTKAQRAQAAKIIYNILSNTQEFNQKGE